MDKKMRSQIRKPIREAETKLKRAEKATTKLADYDERIRDPQIKKLHKLEKSKKHVGKK